ncbi:MAG TPA: hypothetical protein VF789_30690 [Thermoanaerobaculia bacterium]
MEAGRNDEEPAPEIDLDELAERLMRRLTRSLAVESERRGRGPWLWRS